MGMIEIPLLPALVASFLSLYWLTVEMRIIGLLYYTNKEKLGWFSQRLHRTENSVGAFSNSPDSLP